MPSFLSNDKIRPNVLALCRYAVILSIVLVVATLWFALRVVGLETPEEGAEEAIGASVVDFGILIGLAMLAVSSVAATLGGLIALASQVANDPPPPMMPARETIELVDSLHRRQ